METAKKAQTIRRRTILKFNIMSQQLGTQKLKEVLDVQELALKMGYDMSNLDLDQCAIVVLNVQNTFDSDIKQYLQ